METAATESQATSTSDRDGRELILATKPFAVEDTRRSWLHVVSTLAVLALTTGVALLAPWWPARAAAAVLSGLTMVRIFIFFHDHMHGALLKRSPVAKALFTVVGLVLLTPKRVWKETHNYHHAHTAKLVGSHIGSYLMVSTDMWRTMPPGQKRMYKLIRHPMTILFGFFTIFIGGMCVAAFKRNPKKNWDSALALALHAAAAAALIGLGRPDLYVFGLFLPLFVASAAGGYLFYAQHNYPEVDVRPRTEWTYTHAALESSSYMEMGPVMAWFCGNIGYHHVHHLNPGIPFYRLPEAMAALPELQSPGKTSLHPRDIAACFRLKLWDAERQQMVGYPD